MVPNLSNLYPSEGPNGVNFSNSSVIITYDLGNNYIYNLKSIQISKDANKAFFTVTNYFLDSFVQVKNELGKSSIVFDNFVQETITKIQINITNLNSETILNLKIQITACLNQTTVTSTSTSTTTSRMSSPCKNLIDFGSIQNSLSLSSTPQVLNLNNIFLSGVYFANPVANIVFNIDSQVRIIDLKLNKDSSISTITVLLIKDNLIIDTKILISNNLTYFDNFSDKLINRVVLIINNINQTNQIQNVQVKIRACQNETVSSTTPIASTPQTGCKTTTTPLPCTDLTDLNLPNSFVDLVSDSTQNVNLVYPDYTEQGLNFNSSRANVLFKFSKKIARINSINITKDSSLGKISIYLAKDDFAYDIQTFMLNDTLFLNNFSYEKANKILVYVQNMYGCDVKNLKISIQICGIEEYVPPGRSTTTVRPTTTTTTPYYVCLPLIIFEPTNPEVTITASSLVNVTGLYQGPFGKGVNFDKEEVTIVYQLENNAYAQLSHIEIFKDTAISVTTIILFQNDKFLMSKALVSNNQTSLCNITQEPVNRIIISIKNMNGQNVSQVRILISACSVQKVQTPAYPNNPYYQYPKENQNPYNGGSYNKPNKKGYYNQIYNPFISNGKKD